MALQRSLHGVGTNVWYAVHPFSTFNIVDGTEKGVVDLTVAYSRRKLRQLRAHPPNVARIPDHFFLATRAQAMQASQQE